MYLGLDISDPRSSFKLNSKKLQNTKAQYIFVSTSSTKGVGIYLLLVKSIHGSNRNTLIELDSFFRYVVVSRPHFSIWWLIMGIFTLATQATCYNYKYTPFHMMTMFLLLLLLVSFFALIFHKLLLVSDWAMNFHDDLSLKNPWKVHILGTEFLEEFSLSSALFFFGSQCQVKPEHCQWHEAASASKQTKMY